MNFKGVQHLESGKFEYFSVQRVIDGELIPSIMSPEKLIDYINMDDCHQEEYEIFDCSSEFGAIKPLRYKGLQPLGLIDENSEVVLRGYGEDH